MVGRNGGKKFEETQLWGARRTEEKVLGAHRGVLQKHFWSLVSGAGKSESAKKIQNSGGLTGTSGGNKF